MIKPLKELDKEYIKRQQELNEVEVITEANRLLAEKGQEDYDMLRSMGLHHNVQAAIELKGRKLDEEKLEKQYGKIYSVNDIKKIACRYALKFLRSDSYKGSVDAELMQKMREFSRDTGVELTPWSLQNNFYIMAPPNMFHLEDRPKPPVAVIPRGAIDYDPIVFYKIDEGHYRMIHQWGKDLSLWRAFVGWKYTHGFNYFLVWFSLIFLPMFTVLNWMAPSWYWLIPSVATAFLITVRRIAGAGENAEVDLWDGIWDNKIKPKL